MATAGQAVSTIGLWIKRLFMFIIFVILLLFAVNFALSNASQISLFLFGLETPAISVSSWLIMFFISGGCIGLLMSSTYIIKLRIRNRSLKKLLKKQQAVLQKTQNNTLKGLSNV